MGGKAITKVQIRRMNLQEYNQVKQMIICTFGTDCDPNLMVDFSFDKPGKETFGDLDVLYKLDPSSSFVMTDYIREKFNPIQIVTNGDVISWAYEHSPGIFYQIDMIRCDNLDMGKFYFSYGDLGNIIGQITKFWGLKFGHDGLWVLVEAELVKTYCKLDLNTNFNVRSIYSQLLLSTNPEKICNYLDLDFNGWVNGFESQDKIFQWIKSSKFYSPQIYGNPNHSYRHKQKTRPMYRDFIDSIILDKELEFNKINLNLIETQINAIIYFGKIKELDLMIQEENVKQVRKEKFNGKKLMAMGVCQMQVGKFIQDFKKLIESTSCNQEFTWDQWIDSTPQDKIDWFIYQQIFNKMS